jgi:hypothetical protein
MYRFKCGSKRILSLILVTRQEINGFRIWWSVYWIIWLQLLSSPDWVLCLLSLLSAGSHHLAQSSALGSAWLSLLSAGSSSGNLLLSESESYITTDGQSASLSWNKAPIWGLRPDLYYCLTVAGLLMWGVLSDERTGLPFAIATGPRQRSHSRVRVPWDSQPYFTVSD